MQRTYQIVVGWLLAILLLTLISKSRVGYVIIYYILLLSLFFVLVSQYKQIVPLLNFTPITS